jgi:hypothetical protein
MRRRRLTGEEIKRQLVMADRMFSLADRATTFACTVFVMFFAYYNQSNKELLMLFVCAYAAYLLARNTYYLTFAKRAPNTFIRHVAPGDALCRLVSSWSSMSSCLPRSSPASGGSVSRATWCA